MSTTLILNADAQPISFLPLSVESWKEAIKLFYVDRAEMLHFYQSWEAHSPSITLQVPSVIMLKEYVKMPTSVSYSRENIIIRDEFKCQYCGQDYHSRQCELTLDHVIPRYYGGKTNFENIVAACPSCNLEKSHYMKMKPMNKPRKPTYHQLVKKLRMFPIHVAHKSWIDYIGWEKELVIVRNQQENI